MGKGIVKVSLILDSRESNHQIHNKQDSCSQKKSWFSLTLLVKACNQTKYLKANAEESQRVYKHFWPQIKCSMCVAE